MSSTRAPEVKLDARLRKEVESVLRSGETIRSFIKSALQETVERRRVSAEFLARAIANGRIAERENSWVTAEQVFTQMEKRLARARRKR